MTAYLYRCPNCGRAVSDVAPIGKAKKWVKCRDCGKRADRDYIFSVAVPHPTSGARKNRGKG